MPDVNLNPYTAQQAEIDRRRKMAELLSQQSMQPLDGNQMAGGYVLPVSPYAGLAKLLQGYAGGQGQKQAGEDQRALMEQQRAQNGQEAQQFMAALQGTPAVSPQAPMTPNDDEGNTNPMVAGAAAVPGDRNKALAMALQSQNPTIAGAGGAMLADALKGQESLFSKIDPKDYTPESIRLFSATRDPSALVPVRKKDFVNLGGTTQALDPYNTPAGTLQHTQTPDSAARLDQAQRQWAGLSEYQKKELEMQGARLGISGQELLISRANAANRGIETQFNTGSGVVPGAPTLPQIPQQGAAPTPQPQVAMPPGGQAPQQQMAPAGRNTAIYANAAQQPGQPAMTGATQQKMLLNQGEMSNKRDFNMGGLNETLNTAESILKGKKSPTSSGIGSVVDTVGGWFGASPPGAAEAAQLQSIGGNLVAKMPRMEGPQSDKDVLLYKQMAGRIGDETVPLPQRIAALQTVRQLYAKYERGSQQAAKPAGIKFLGFE